MSSGELDTPASPLGFPPSYMASRAETPTEIAIPKTVGEEATSSTQSTSTKFAVESVKQPTLLVGKHLFLVFMYAVVSLPSVLILTDSFSGFLVSFLLTALDQTIVATALPRIASDFDGWCTHPKL